MNTSATQKAYALARPTVYALILTGKIGYFYLTLVLVVFLYFIATGNPAIISQNPTIIFTLVSALGSFALLEILEVRGVVKAAHYIHDPQRELFGTLSPLNLSSELEPRIHDSLNKKGMALAKLFRMESRIPNAFSFSTSSGEDSIILTEALLEIMSDDELEPIIYHEVYHTIHDTRLFNAEMLMYELDSFRNWRKWKWSPLYPAFAFSLATFLQLRAYALHMEYQWQIDLVKNLLLGGLALAFVIVILYSVWLFRIHNLISLPSFMYNREIIADSYASIMCMSPMRMQSALSKIEMEKHLGRIIIEKRLEYINKVSFISPTEEAGYNKPSKLSHLLKTEPFSGRDLAVLYNSTYDTTPIYTMANRISLTNVINKLLFHESEVDVLCEDVILPSLVKLRLPNDVLEVLKQDNTYLSFLEYVKDRQTSFNLLDCSKYLGFDPFDAFLLLFAAINTGIMDMKLEN